MGSGILLAVTFLEILPEAWERDSSVGSWGVLAAFLLLFALESFTTMHSCPEYLEECAAHVVGWTALVAMSLHSLLDGFNLSVSFQASRATGATVGLALALHKFADGLTLTSLFRESGYSPRNSFWICSLLALATPLGSLLSAPILSRVGPEVLAALLGFTAGSFLYIGAADILPRIHKAHDKLCPVLFTVGLLCTGVLKKLGGSF